MYDATETEWDELSSMDEYEDEYEYEADEFEEEDPEFGEEFEVTASRNSPEYVRWVQRSLNKVMGLRLAVDGISGPQTRSAVRAFQQRRGLTVDGIVGPQTEAALSAASGEPPPGRVITLPPVIIRVPGFILDRFNFDGSGLQPFHGPIIERIAARIHTSWQSGQPVRTVRLEGHTDPVGSDAYNIGLGQRRALAVRTALQQAVERRQRGLGQRVLILVSSKGEREPIDPASTPDAAARNRRVEVFLSTQALPPPRPRPPAPRPPEPRPPEPRPTPRPPEPRPQPPRPPAPGCNRAELERRVNRCIEESKRCLIEAHAKLLAALAQCRLNPFCNARAMAAYYVALRNCREALLACDRQAKQDTHCG